MKIVRAYRLGDDGYLAYRVPSPGEQKRRMIETFGEVYSLMERTMLKGSIPQPIPRVNEQEAR